MIASIVFIILGGLKLGIDFKGGTMMRLKFDKEVPTQEVVTVLTDLNLGGVQAQSAGTNEISLRLKTIPNETRQSILDKLNEKFGTVSELSFDSIGPTIGREVGRKAIMAIVIVLLAIILYITWAFRKVSMGPVSSWLYGLNAILALVHDLLITVGVFAALGYFFNVEIDVLFVTALLTILGFSVHDTIVVFDRIRENLRISYYSTFEEVVNRSVNETIIRSLNTSLTTLFVLSALYLFGGETIKFFVLALLVGITIGTYSSIFIASPLLIIWQKILKKS